MKLNPNLWTDRKEPTGSDRVRRFSKEEEKESLIMKPLK